LALQQERHLQKLHIDVELYQIQRSILTATPRVF
jgi:hypothetical protein